MRTTIDGAGRIVIPQALRREARLEGAREVEVRVHDGVIEIEAPPTPVRIARRGRLQVAMPLGPAKPLKSAEVEATRERVRRGGGR